MKRHFRLAHFAVLSISLFLTGLATNADDLVSLDDPAPVASPASLDSLDGSTAAAKEDAEVSLDLGAGTAAGAAEFFNPYTFSRNPLWILLPVFGILIVALHLLPVPKRKSKRQIDQAKRFFGGLNGEGTNVGIQRPAPAPASEEHTVAIASRAIPAATGEKLEIVETRKREGTHTFDRIMKKKEGEE